MDAKDWPCGCRANFFLQKMLSLILNPTYIKVENTKEVREGVQMENVMYGVLQNTEEDLVISEHGYTRLKQRNGWSRKASARMIGKVYQNGLRPDQVKGYLKSWINNKADYGKDGNEFVLFGEKLYIFNGNTMITVLPTPSKSYLLKEA